MIITLVENLLILAGFIYVARHVIPELHGVILDTLQTLRGHFDGVRSARISMAREDIYLNLLSVRDSKVIQKVVDATKRAGDDIEELKRILTKLVQQSTTPPQETL